MSIPLITCPFCGGEAKSTFGGASPDDWPERHGCEVCWVFRETAEGWNTRAQPRTPLRGDTRPGREGDRPISKEGMKQLREDWDSTPAAPDDASHAGLTPDQEQASSFVLPFGKHKGQTLGDIVRTSKGRDYLTWLLDWEGLRDETREALEAFRGPAAGENQGRAIEADY